MKTALRYLLLFTVPAMTLPSCVDKCEDCTYYETVNGKTTTEPLGEHCGDEIKALEKKEYYVPNGEGHAECE